jgi:hypothetical protein
VRRHDPAVLQLGTPGADGLAAVGVDYDDVVHALRKTPWRDSRRRGPELLDTVAAVITLHRA